MSRGFGIFGTGVIATIHADAIVTLPDARLVAVTGRAAGTAQAFAAARGCLAEPDPAALLARRDVEVVCVCVPNGLHPAEGSPRTCPACCSFSPTFSACRSPP